MYYNIEAQIHGTQTSKPCLILDGRNLSLKANLRREALELPWEKQGTLWCYSLQYYVPQPGAWTILRKNMAQIGIHLPPVRIPPTV